MSKNRQTLSIQPAAAPAAASAPVESSAPEGANEQATASAAANQGDQPEVPAADVIAQATAWEIGDVVELVSVHGPLQHLHTGELFGAAPVPAEIDAFLALQLNAGKLAIVPSES
ncbi:hypothetical protein J7E62_31020 [Variovorax paradoxus]|nr:hypothetical protein [Variovorax paradoxus]